MREEPERELTPEEIAAAEKKLLEFKTKRALRGAPDLLKYVRDYATDGYSERGETLPVLSAPLMVTTVDDVDKVFSQLVDWTRYWARQLLFTPPEPRFAPPTADIRGMRAGTTAMQAWILTSRQTAFLLKRAPQINRHPQAPVYQTDVVEIFGRLRGRYPTAPRPAQHVYPRPCPTCGEAAVGAEWYSDRDQDVEIRCANCGQTIPVTPHQIEKWIS